MDKELQDYLEEKEIKRKALMSEEERKEAETFLEWYRKAYTDKTNRGLLIKWEEIDKYWEGNIDDDIIDENEPASNTNITNSNVEGKVALLCDQNIAIQVDPIEPSDRPFCERVKILADFIKEKNKMYRKIDIHERRREKFGTGIFRVLWNFKALDNLGLPEIEPISPAKIVVDPSVVDIYKIQDSKYIIEACNKSIYSAKLKYGNEIADAIIENYDPVAQSFYGNFEEHQYLHLFVWTRYKDKAGNLLLRLIEMTGCGIILSDTKKKLSELKDKKLEELTNKKLELIKEGKIKEAEELKEEEIRLFPNEMYPYFFTPDMYRENSIWGKGSAELVIPLSDQIDELDNQILNNARLAGNPQRLVGNNSGIDCDKITNEPGLVIPTNDITASRWETPPSMPTYILNKRTELMNSDRAIVTRFNDQMIR